MRRTRFNRWPCPIARTTDLIGDWWTPLVMREAFLGRRRFEDFQRALKAPRAVLAHRLERVEPEGLLNHVSYGGPPPQGDGAGGGAGSGQREVGNPPGRPPPAHGPKEGCRPPAAPGRIYALGPCSRQADAVWAARIAADRHRHARTLGRATAGGGKRHCDCAR